MHHKQFPHSNHSTEMAVDFLKVMVLSTAFALTYGVVLSENEGVCYVSNVNGNDSKFNKGNNIPFRTIQRCADELSRGDRHCGTCNILPGTYRENVVIHTHSDHSSMQVFVANKTDTVFVSGLQTLETSWRLYNRNDNCMYVTNVHPNITSIPQLFYGGKMMVEARWPNLNVSDVAKASLSRKSWEKVGVGSVYGKIYSDDIKNLNYSLSGALATLNVAHQFYTWTRFIEHAIGDDFFTYSKDLPGLGNFGEHPNGTQWGGKCVGKCNQYFLSGKFEMLDSAGEFFHDNVNNKLYFIPPTATGSSACKPPMLDTEYKTRNYTFVGAMNLHGIHIDGINHKGATMKIGNCSNCTFTNQKLIFPTYSKEALESNPAGKQQNVPTTAVNGYNILLKNVQLMYTNNNGLIVRGNNVRVENCLIAWTDWIGSLKYSPLGAIGNHIVITNTTVKYFGNAGIVTGIPNTAPSSPGEPAPVPQPMSNRYLEVSYCHIHHGGLIGMDTAALYTGGWNSAGQHWHHNWIHDATEKCLRADDQSANMTVHHNVIFNCGMEPTMDVASATAGLGIILKGDGHIVYANTVFSANYTELCMPSCIEPLKSFRKQFPRVMQNTRTQIFNVAARRDVGYPCSCHNSSFLHKPGGNTTALFQGVDLMLQDPHNFNFVPQRNSKLVDSGAIVPPYTNGHVGIAPDIGAYEYGGEKWVPGYNPPRGL